MSCRPDKTADKNNITQVYNLKFTIHFLVFILIFTGYVSSFDGFVTYSKGDAHKRTLYMREFKASGEFGPEKMICEKGTIGGDIEGQISFDGKWLAFARSIKCAGCDENKIDKFGGNDYHMFMAWDIYVVRIDGTLPATPKRVGVGYWPSWGIDSKNPKKTLYYAHYPCKPHTYDCTNCSMKKSTIDAEGNASDEQVVVDGGLLQFPFMSPDGNFVGHASGASNIMAKYVAGPMKGKDIKVGMKKGCHTHVTADSKWVIAATGQVGKSDGSWAGKSGLGSYHFGSSQDMKWAVTRSQPGAQNHGLECKLFSLNTEGGNWKVTAVGAFSDDASWVDVHTYEKTSNKILQKTPQRMAATLSGKGIQFKVDKPGQYRIEIFNSLGKQVGFLQLRSLTQGKNFVAWSRILNNEIKSSMSRVHIVRIKADKGEFVQRWVF